MTDIHADVLIIGAGSVGLPVAYHMAKAGARVAIVEKHTSVGRGQNRAAIGGIRATHSDPAKILICGKSLELIRNMKEKTGYDVLWRQGGYLYPVYTEKDETALKNLLAVQHSYNLDISWIDAAHVAERVPGINTRNLRGGTWSPGDGSASPINLADAYYRLAVENGADFYFDQTIEKINVSNKQIRHADSKNIRFFADLVINCAGAGAGELGKLTGHDFPVYPESHEAGITEPVQRLFDPMIVDIRPVKESANYYFYQNSEGQIVFCITPEPNIPGHDIDSTSRFLPQVVERMIDIYPRLRHVRVRRTWRGLYPMTPDGSPIVGFANGLSNYYLAIGMCGQGFMLGPGLGSILSDKLINKNREYDDTLGLLNPDREFSIEERLK